MVTPTNESNQLRYFSSERGGATRNLLELGRDEDFLALQSTRPDRLADGALSEVVPRCIDVPIAILHETGQPFFVMDVETWSSDQPSAR